MTKQRTMTVLFVFMTMMVVVILMNRLLFYPQGDTAQIRYFSDPTAMLVLPQAIARFVAGEEVIDAPARVYLGNNLHVWWFELPLHEWNPSQAERYLIIHNPFVANLVVYVPQQNGSYLPLLGGWKNANADDSEFFLKPTFWLDSSVDWTRPAYIRIRSPYSHHYEFELLSRSEFNHYSNHTTQIASIFLGVLLFLIMFQLMAYWRLRQPAFLVYTLFLITVIIYQMILLGLNKVMFGGLLSGLSGMGVQAAFVMIIFSILFTLSFFKPVLQKPGHRYLALILVLLALPGIGFLAIHCPMRANWYAYHYALVVGLSVFVLAFFMLKKGHQHAYNFLIGWSLLFISAIISALRMRGYISNNPLSSNITWIAVATQSIVFNLALFDRFQNLHAVAEQDELTRVGNRYAGTNYLTESFLNYRMGSLSPAVIFFDLDRFKQVNDSYGHAVGDEVLIRVVAAVQANVRETDRIFRWGGDEFVLVCHGLSQLHAEEVCRTIDAAVRKLQFRANGQKFGTFISMGMAWFEPEDDSFTEALKRADRHLYKEKKHNRNLYAVATETSP